MPKSTIGNLQFRFIRGEFPVAGVRVRAFETNSLPGYGMQHDALKGGYSTVTGEAAFATIGERTTFIQSCINLKTSAYVNCYDDEGILRPFMVVQEVQAPRTWQTVNDTGGKNYQCAVPFTLLCNAV